MSLIKVEAICAGYSKDNVIENISFEINDKELVGVLGVNGCGKSTLAKAVCNVIPHKGRVTIDNQVIEELRSSQVANIISYIPQHSGISIDISLTDVVMMGFNSRLKLFENPDRFMKEQAKRIIKELGLADKANSNYMLLSEGQKQLAILARSLVSNGRLIVMDEPESALDFRIRYKIMQSVKNWTGKGERAGLIILHDTMLALNNCDRLILINDKTIVDTVDLHNDTIEMMETKLSKIYGDISLVKINSKDGRENLVMICNEEDL